MNICSIHRRRHQYIKDSKVEICRGGGRSTIPVEAIAVETIAVEVIASCADPGGESINDCC